MIYRGDKTWVIRASDMKHLEHLSVNLVWVLRCARLIF